MPEAKRDKAAKSLEARRQRIAEIIGSGEWAEFREYCVDLICTSLEDTLNAAPGLAREAAAARTNALREILQGFEVQEANIKQVLATRFFAAQTHENQPKAYRQGAEE